MHEKCTENSSQMGNIHHRKSETRNKKRRNKCLYLALESFRRQDGQTLRQNSKIIVKEREKSSSTRHSYLLLIKLNI